MRISRTKQIRARLLNEGVDVPGTRVLDLLKEFNEWEMPIGDRVVELSAGIKIKEFAKFINNLK